MIRRGFAWLLVLAACEKGPAEPLENATPSPNASILPAPLSSMAQPAAESPLPAASGSGVEPGAAPALLDAGAAPQPLRGDQAPEADPITQRELTGVTLEGEWRYPDLPPPPKAPEVNGAGIEAARKLTALRMTIDLASAGRMRIIVDSRAMPVASGVEIRARVDHFGHVLVWPDGSRYRVLPPGAARTLLEERRIDATPLVRAQTPGRGEGPRRIGFPTRKWELATPSGKLVLEQARLSGAGEGGALLCRFLSEIIAIDPSAAPCAADEVPLRAQYTWQQGPGIVFEASAVAERVEFSSSQLLVPPSAGEFTPTGLPPDTNGIFLGRDELAAFRSRPVDPGVPKVRGAPDEGLALYNTTDALRYAFVDTVPVAWIAPNREQIVLGPPRGRYLVQWRTFLGDFASPAALLEIPARVSLGLPDGGTRER